MPYFLGESDRSDRSCASIGHVNIGRCIRLEDQDGSCPDMNGMLHSAGRLCHLAEALRKRGLVRRKPQAIDPGSEGEHCFAEWAGTSKHEQLLGLNGFADHQAAF